MPTLPIPRRTGFEAPVAGGRRATAADFGGGVDLGGKAIQQAAVGYLAETEESEARKALVSASEIRAKYARELDAAAMDGRDLGALKEKMQDELAQVGADFQTKRGQDSLALYQSNTELMYDEQANRIAVQRAYTDAQVQGQKLINSIGAELQRDPTQVKFAEKTVSEFLDTFKNLQPGQRAELADRWHKSVNMSAAVASARRDPLGTKERLLSGEWNLTPEQRASAINNAETEDRAKRAEESYLRDQERIRRVENDSKARDKHFKTIIDGGASRRAIMDDADLLPATREHLIDYMTLRQRAARGEEKVSDAAAVRDLWLRIRAPEGDPRKIYTAEEIVAAVKSGAVNTRDGDKLLADVANMKDENNRAFGTQLQGRISVVAAAMRGAPEYQNQPELSAAIQLQLVARVEQEASRLRSEKRSPYALLDPESKDYFFKPGTIKSIADDVKRQRDQQTISTMDIGTVVIKDGVPWRYLGGDRSNPKSWAKEATVSPADARESDRTLWMNETGGVLAAGQTEEQALTEWRRAKDLVR